MVAAPTTSLPETPGGERNWDYRYTWMRDATFTLQGLHALGLDWEADDFIQFVADLERNEDGVAADHVRRSAASATCPRPTLDHLTGYEGARPVRIGNGAHDQRQNDVYGAVLDSLYLHQKEYGHNSPRLWPVIEDQVEQRRRDLARARPGHLGGARRAPALRRRRKLMCWVALDRGARLAARRGYDELADEWRVVANEIHAEICEQRRRRARRLHPALRHRRARRLQPADPARPLPAAATTSASARTVLAIADELTENGLVLRYRDDETDDGLGGRGGHVPDLLVLARLGAARDRRAQARPRSSASACSSLASPLDLYAEELDAATGRHLGNFPQAFTHLALINAVMHVIRDEETVPDI